MMLVLRRAARWPSWLRAPLCAALLSAALAGCTTVPQREAAVSYSGTLPCADCAGQQIDLTLFGDHSFRMRTRYLGVADDQQRYIFDLGRWERSDAGVLKLHGAREAPMQFSAGGGDTRLTLLDLQGLPMRSALNYTLQRRDAIVPIDGPMPMLGMYRYLADAASFDECRTGKRWPVQLAAGHPALERAYLASRQQPGQPVLASIEGRFETSAAEPGAATHEFIVVHRFDRLWPGETCVPQAAGKAELLNTRWRLVEVDGQPLVPMRGPRAPNILLSGDGNKLSGFGGCNRISGGFEQRGDGLSFTKLARTRMACRAGVDDLESRWVRTLQATVTRRIVGDSLQLRDVDGALRLRFEALYLD